MEHLMTKEESYAERRKLFKDIWETSMHIDEKEDIMNKPKVIKTLRLSEMDRCAAGKKKKQRIKNLRAVCNKLLDFCDRQDADDLFYEQMTAQGKIPPTRATELKIKKIKKIKVKRKVKKTKSLSEATNATAPARGTTSERKNFVRLTRNTISRYTSPIKVKRTSVAFTTRKVLKPKQSSKITKKNNTLGDNNDVIRRKVVRKKLSKKNKPSDLEIPPGRKIQYKYVFTPIKTPTLTPTRKHMIINKVNVSYSII